MNYGQINHLLTFVKYMNVTKAAKELYITQSALSQSLSKIESELGIQLFRRESNRMSLTREGTELLPEFQQISQAFSALFEKATHMTSGQEHTITIGFSGSAPIFLAMFASGFLASYKGIPVKKVYADHEQLQHFLQAHEIDLAIAYPPVTGEGIGCLPFLRDELLLVLSEKHPLAEKAMIRAEDISKYSFTLLKTSHPFRRMCDKLLKEAGLTLTVRCAYDYAEFMKAVETERGGRDFATLTVENSFQKWYGTGYVCRTIEDCKMYQTTAVSWMIGGNAQEKYHGLIDLIEQRYRQDYDAADARAVHLFL